MAVIGFRRDGAVKGIILLHRVTRLGLPLKRPGRLNPGGHQDAIPDISKLMLGVEMGGEGVLYNCREVGEWVITPLGIKIMPSLTQG